MKPLTSGPPLWSLSRKNRSVASARSIASAPVIQPRSTRDGSVDNANPPPNAARRILTRGVCDQSVGWKHRLQGVVEAGPLQLVEFLFGHRLLATHAPTSPTDASSANSSVTAATACGGRSTSKRTVRFSYENPSGSFIRREAAS